MLIGKQNLSKEKYVNNTDQHMLRSKHVIQTKVSPNVKVREITEDRNN